jgi:hypothetical protein
MGSMEQQRGEYDIKMYLEETEDKGTLHIKFNWLRL